VNEDQELIPIEQHTLTFYGKPIIVVRLPDGRSGVVLRFLCENLHIDTNAQVQRVQRSEAMAEDLVFTRVETPGGAQRMATLVLRSIAYWFATIDTRRMEKDDPRCLAIVQYQREAVDVLYAWAAAPQVREAPSTKLVPSEPIVEPTRPAADASLAEWHEYYVRMAAVLEWQMEVEAWRGGIEDRLEGWRRLPADPRNTRATACAYHHAGASEQSEVLRLPVQPGHGPAPRRDLQRSLYLLQRAALPGAP
jgi:hypothetical protein